MRNACCGLALSHLLLVAVLHPIPVAGIKTKSSLASHALKTARNILADAGNLANLVATAAAATGRSLTQAVVPLAQTAAAAAAANPLTAAAGLGLGLLTAHGFTHAYQGHIAWTQINGAIEAALEPLRKQKLLTVLKTNLPLKDDEDQQPDTALLKLLDVVASGVSVENLSDLPGEVWTKFLECRTELFEIMTIPEWELLLEDFVEKLSNPASFECTNALVGKSVRKLFVEEGTTVAKNSERILVKNVLDEQSIEKILAVLQAQVETLWNELQRRHLVHSLKPAELRVYRAARKAGLEAVKAAINVTDREKHSLLEIITMQLSLEPLVVAQTAVDVARKALGEEAQSRRFRLGYREEQMRQYLTQAEILHLIVRDLLKNKKALNSGSTDSVSMRELLSNLTIFDAMTRLEFKIKMFSIAQQKQPNQENASESNSMNDGDQDIP